MAGGRPALKNRSGVPIGRTPNLEQYILSALAPSPTPSDRRKRMLHAAILNVPISINTNFILLKCELQQGGAQVAVASRVFLTCCSQLAGCGCDRGRDDALRYSSLLVHPQQHTASTSTGTAHSSSRSMSIPSPSTTGFSMLHTSTPEPVGLLITAVCALTWIALETSESWQNGAANATKLLTIGQRCYNQLLVKDNRPVPGNRRA